MSYDPFASVIAKAEANEAAQAQLISEQVKKQQALAEQRQAVQQTEAQRLLEAQQAEERRLKALKRFGLRFLEVVVEKVIRPDWKSEYLLQIKAYAEALLCRDDKDLPRINERHAGEILGIFAFGLELAKRDNVEIEEGFFFGQRLLAERQPAKEAPQPRLVIKPGERPRGPRPVATDSGVADLPPATTPRIRRDRRPASAR